MAFGYSPFSQHTFPNPLSASAFNKNKLWVLNSIPYDTNWSIYSNWQILTAPLLFCLFSKKLQAIFLHKLLWRIYQTGYRLERIYKRCLYCQRFRRKNKKLLGIQKKNTQIILWWNNRNWTSWRHNKKNKQFSIRKSHWEIDDCR